MEERMTFYAPVKIAAGIGESRKLDQWMEEFGAKKIMLITGKHVAKSEGFLKIKESLEEKGIPYEVFSDCLPEPPMEVVDQLAEILRGSDIDIVAAVGGGSPMDTAKAVCMLKNNEGSIKEYLFGGSRTPENPSIPLLCIPTTAGSGSEVSCASVIEDTQRHIKLSCTHPNLYPKVAILDPLMQLSMPASVTAGTGMDALTHAIESFTSKHASVFSRMYSKEAIRLIGIHLPIVMKEPENIESRMMMAQASSMAAVAMANGGLGAIHGISQSMGGIAHTPHGMTNAILLPKVMAYNWKGDPESFAEIASLLGVDISAMSLEEAAQTAGKKVKELADEIGIPETVDQFGVKREMFPAIVEGTMGYRLLWMNPIPFTEELAYQILEESLADA
jgi:alcohol dehydrogenase